MKAQATLKYGNLTFTMELPATRVPESKNPIFNGADVQRFEQEAAKWVITNAAVSPETFRLLRSAAGLTQTQLAELLDSDKETISRWENGRNAFALGTWYILASLATDAMKGKTTTRDWLRNAQRAKMESTKGKSSPSRPAERAQIAILSDGMRACATKEEAIWWAFSSSASWCSVSPFSVRRRRDLEH